MKISIDEDSTGSPHRAREFARRLSLPVNLENPDVVVRVSEQGTISLSCPKEDPKARLSISFHSGSADHRRKFGGGKSQMIAKAVGIEPGVFPQILDVTAGLGGDAFVLASLGARVVAVERSPVLAAMLVDAKERALNWVDEQIDPIEQNLVEILGRLDFFQAEALELMSRNEGLCPEVIYLDPMFPERKKKAAVKKEMKILQRLLEFDQQNDEALLECALEKASHRVVVKRPRHAPPIEGPKAQYSLEGKSTRFDIYPLKSLRANR